jgi:hypothetical protein
MPSDLFHFRINSRVHGVKDRTHHYLICPRVIFRDMASFSEVESDVSEERSACNVGIEKQAK